MRIGCHPPNRAASAILASRVWGLSETNRTHRSTWSAGTAASAAAAARNRKLKARARRCFMEGGKFRRRPELRSNKPARALIGFRNLFGNVQTNLSYIGRRHCRADSLVRSEVARQQAPPAVSRAAECSPVAADWSVRAPCPSGGSNALGLLLVYLEKIMLVAGTRSAPDRSSRDSQLDRSEVSRKPFPARTSGTAMSRGEFLLISIRIVWSCFDSRSLGAP